MPKTTKKYDTCSENNTFLPFCPRPNMWEKSWSYRTFINDYSTTYLQVIWLLGFCHLCHSKSKLIFIPFMSPRTAAIHIGDVYTKHLVKTNHVYNKKKIVLLMQKKGIFWPLTLVELIFGYCWLNWTDMTLIFRVRPTSFHSESCWEPELRYVMMHGEHAQLYDMFQSNGHYHAKYTPPVK